MILLVVFLHFLIFGCVFWGFFGCFMGIFWGFFGSFLIRVTPSSGFFWKNQFEAFFEHFWQKGAENKPKRTFLCMIQLFGIKKPLTSLKITQKTPFRYQKTPEKQLKFAKNYQNPVPSLSIFSIFMLLCSRIDQKTPYFFKNNWKNSLLVSKNPRKTTKRMMIKFGHFSSFFNFSRCFLRVFRGFWGFFLELFGSVDLGDS